MRNFKSLLFDTKSLFELILSKKFSFIGYLKNKDPFKNF